MILKILVIRDRAIEEESGETKINGGCGRCCRNSTVYMYRKGERMSIDCLPHNTNFTKFSLFIIHS